MTDFKRNSETPVCHGCKKAISDDFLFQVAPNQKWHSSCLQCTACNETLTATPSCFMKKGRLYCKKDYDTLFGVKCKGCNEAVDQKTLVIKTECEAFHVNCFNCSVCGERLCPGDQFTLSSDSQPCCTAEDCIRERNAFSDDASDGGNSYGNKNIEQGSFMDSESSPSPTNMPVTLKTNKLLTENKAKGTLGARKSSKEKPTRVRTVLNEKQLTTLKRCYAANPRPDSVMKEQLVDLTGLSPRVIRVWFQNKRCKDKKKSLMMMNGSESTSRDLVHGQLAIHSSPLSDELSLPGCSPPLSTAPTISMTTQPNTIVDGVQNLNGITNNNIYTSQASFGGYGLWTKYGNYHCAYQDTAFSNGQYDQIVA